jgi:hypothetical protein
VSSVKGIIVVDNWILGITDVSNLPKLIELNNDVIQKISCGLKHSLLLSSVVFIYSFGDNSYGQLGSNNQENKSKPVKLIHKNRFIDITSHFDENISFELSVEGIYYFWGSLGIKYYLTPIESNFKSFNEISLHCCDKKFVINDDIIQFKDPFFRNEYFRENFKKLKELGSGSFGKIVKAKNKYNRVYAIKKIKSNIGDMNGILEEFLRYSLIYKIKSKFLVEYHYAWFEYINENERKSELLLYIEMELCDKTLKDVINEIKRNFDSNQLLYRK